MRRSELWLVLGVVLLVAVPLLLHRLSGGGELVGSDNRAVDAIGSIAPGYQPWAQPLWVPPGKPAERMLFGLQAAFGVLVFVYCACRVRGRARERERERRDAAD